MKNIIDRSEKKIDPILKYDNFYLRKINEKIVLNVAISKWCVGTTIDNSNILYGTPIKNLEASIIITEPIMRILFRYSFRKTIEIM